MKDTQLSVFFFSYFDFTNVFIQFSCNFIIVMVRLTMYSNRKLCYNENKKYYTDWGSVEIGQIY